MRGRPPTPVVKPNGKERTRLKRLVARRKAPFAVVQRARIIVELRRGQRPGVVARRLGVSVSLVRKWRSRWNRDPRVESLNDLPRSGRPPTVSLEMRCTLVRLACERPDKVKVPFHEVWTQQALADALKLEAGLTVSRSTVSRVLNAEGLRPHRVRYWLHSPDPKFREKVRRICALYTEPPPGAVILCVDEKPMQALERRFPTKVGPRGVLRREYEYIRHGTAALLAAFNIATGRVVAQVVPKRSGDALVEFMDVVAAQYPDRDVYVVWDNLNTHYDGPSGRWTTFNEQHGGRFTFVYTPLHASWVNQVEIWFSIVHRRVLHRASFDSTDQLKERVEGFARHWNTREARPFKWTFQGNFVDNAPAEAA